MLISRGVCSMFIELATIILIASLLSFTELERREARLRAGAPGWRDLARITGVADHRELLRLPGVSLTGDGSLRFNPSQRAELPVHLTGSILEHPIGHGMSVSLAIVCFGAAVGWLNANTPVWPLLTAAAVYQLLCRLYALSLWVEHRSAT